MNSKAFPVKRFPSTVLESLNSIFLKKLDRLFQAEVRSVLHGYEGTLLLLLSKIFVCMPLSSGPVPFWESVHCGIPFPLSRGGGVHSLFLDVGVCIKVACSTSPPVTHIALCDYSVLLWV